MAEPREPANSGTVQKYLGDKEILRAWKRPPLTLANWFGDGTLIFAAQDNDRDGGLELEEGLAAPYQNQFKKSPELVAALGRAFNGEPVSETVRIDGAPWDVRLFPVFKGNKIGGVVGSFADARDRITARRAVTAIEVLSQIRHDLARSDSTQDFLSHCCNAIGKLHSAVWIGVADRGAERKLHVVTGTDEPSRQFASSDLSWDVGRKGGRHPAAEAVNSGRVQIIRNIADCKDADMWINAAADSRSLLAVPLLASGACLGVLVIHSNDENDFDAEMIGLWEKIAGELTEGIQLLQAREERARIMRERQGAYQQYQQLLDTIFDIVVVHRAGRVIEINPAGMRLFGALTSDQLIGTQVVTLIHPEDRERMRDTLRESAGSDKLQEFRLLSLDGVSIDVEGVTVSLSHEGAPARLSHWRDISHRKRAEALILQQNTSLEYAQHVGQFGSVELEVTSGHTKWSRNALAILGVSAERQDERFVDVLSSVVVDQDKVELGKFIDSICQHGKESSCEVALRSDDPANATTIHIQGIPQTEQHIRVPRIFIVVQDTSRYRNTERTLKAKLQETWKLARVVEWIYDLEKQIIIWEGSIKDFLGFDSPVSHLTYQQFMASIRKEDRELVRRSVEQSLKHDVDGEMVYQETFDRGLTLLLYGRWRPEKNAAGKIVRLRGLSMDVTNIRLSHDRETREKRLHHSGLPEREMVSDRVLYLGACAVKYDKPFSLIGIRIQNYPELKRHMADDELYYRTQVDIARAVMEAVPQTDTFGRLGLGCFVVILSRVSTTEDVSVTRNTIVQGWQNALSQCETCLLDTVTVDTSVVNCPQDGTDGEGLLALLDRNFN